MLYLYNTSILPNAGLYSLEDISVEQAKNLLKNNAYQFTSSIGHESTAKIMTDILGFPIEVNRINASLEVGDSALVFKLNGRPPEGKILTLDDIEDIGYKFQYLKRIE